MMIPITTGRLWWLRIYYWKPDGNLYIELGLSQLSILACPEVSCSVGPRREKPGYSTQHTELQWVNKNEDSLLLVPHG